ncbi:hypothetical protein LDL59_09645 [Kaistella anthropi]|nr:hypothetical protein [Kaistella anthropi]
MVRTEYSRCKIRQQTGGNYRTNEYHPQNDAKKYRRRNTLQHRWTEEKSGNVERDKKLYKEDALVPVSPWIKATKPATPNIKVEKSSESYKISWNSKEKVFRWVLFAKYGDIWITDVLNPDQLSKSIPANQFGKKLNTIAIIAIDRLSNESDYAAEKF